MLRDDFRPDSDVDVLVTFEADSHWSLFDMIDMQDELKGNLNRAMDLVERRAVERSENYIRRRQILQSLESVDLAVNDIPPLIALIEPLVPPDRP